MDQHSTPTTIIGDESLLKTWVAHWCTGIERGSWVWLTGEVGAGKTTLSSILIETLTGTTTGGSPTFPIISVYESKKESWAVGPIKKVIHGDLYRLKTPLDLLALGIDMEWTAESIFCVEWGDLFSALQWGHVWPLLGLPPPTLSYHIHLKKREQCPLERSLVLNQRPGFEPPFQ